MNNLENILERQHLLNERILDCINDQTTTVDRIVGVGIETKVEDKAQPKTNGLIEQLLEAQERSNSLLSIFGDNNRRLREAVYFKAEAGAPYTSGIGTVRETNL